MPVKVKIRNNHAKACVVTRGTKRDPCDQSYAIFLGDRYNIQYICNIYKPYLSESKLEIPYSRSRDGNISESMSDVQ